MELHKRKSGKVLLTTVLGLFLLLCLVQEDEPARQLLKDQNVGECQGWCLHHSDPWDVKCAVKHCKGCSECFDQDEEVLLDKKENNEKPPNKFIMEKNETYPVLVDRIYYINMDHRTDKRKFMESWLEPFSKKYSVPYYRISGKTGVTGVCKQHHSDSACIGMTGLLYSNWDIMDNHNTTGITLVLEDDYAIGDYPKLLKSLAMAPDDWDVLRFDLWQNPFKHYPRFQMGKLGYGFRTLSTKEGHWFCGGTHLTVWRGDKVDKLRKHWDHHPRMPIDCLLAADNITSYALETRVGKRDESRGSDIPKRTLTYLNLIV
jgi:hypothetical protein